MADAPEAAAETQDADTAQDGDVQQAADDSQDNASEAAAETQDADTSKDTAESRDTDASQDAAYESNTADAADASDTDDPSNTTDTSDTTADPVETSSKGTLLYMGHSSIRITTPEGKVIYIDPYAGDGYEAAADLILVTHGHYDHYDLDKVANRNPDCRTITWQEALLDGVYQNFDLGFVSVETVEAGNNQYHSAAECVGYILTLTDGISVYVTGDTSTTQQMPSLAEKEIDYAFFCCDGVYNMNLEEAAKCAEMVKAKHNIPYHMIPADSGRVFDRSVAEQFNAPDLLILEDGQEIELE